MQAQKQLEATMDKYLVKDAPIQIPENGRKALVQYAPFLAIIGGILTLLGALSLWRLAHDAKDVVDGLNEIARTYGIDTGVNTVNYGVLFYVSFAILVAQGLLLLFAFKGLQAKSKKRGWDLLLLSIVANFVYGLVYAFTDTGSLINIVSSVIGTVIGLYILAQIKSYYTTPKTAKKNTAAKA